MGLFRKTCIYCRKKIDNGTEEFRVVKVPGYVGTFNKPFCCKEHADKYQEELCKRPQQKSRGGCCG